MLRRGAQSCCRRWRSIFIGDVKPGMKEQELAAKIDWRIKSARFRAVLVRDDRRERAEFRLAARPPGDRVLREGDLVVLDFGGVYGGYCVDLTRTVAVGEPDAEMARVYQAVLEAQRSGHRRCQAWCSGRGHRRGGPRRRSARHGLAEAFGHSTGHGLGVEIHETPRIGPRREAAGDAPAAPDEAIEPGMVFTIEPGAYLPGWGGVRIEDDVLVTSDGVEVLTNVPTSLTHTHGI